TVAAVAAIAAALAVAAPGGVRPAEAAALAAVVVVVLAAAVTTTPRPGLRCVLIAAVAVNVIALPISYRGRLLWSLDALSVHAPLFAGLEPRLGPQDRVFLMPDATAAVGLGLMQKTSTVLRVPGLFDYEALFGRRFAEYFTVFRRGTGHAGLIDVY